MTVIPIEAGSENEQKEVLLEPLFFYPLRIWSKIRAILGWLKFVSAYVEKDEKILKNFIFAFAPLRK